MKYMYLSPVFWFSRAFLAIEAKVNFCLALTLGVVGLGDPGLRTDARLLHESIRSSLATALRLAKSGFGVSDILYTVFLTILIYS